MVTLDHHNDLPVLAVQTHVGEPGRLAAHTKDAIIGAYRAVKGKSLLSDVIRRFAHTAESRSDQEVIDMVRMTQDQIGDNARIMRRVLGGGFKYLRNLVL